MSQREIDHAEWANPANWHGGLLGLYSSPRDSRVWVPKRRPEFGWTLNLAHAAGRWWLLGLTVGPLLLIVIVVVVMGMSG